MKKRSKTTYAIYNEWGYLQYITSSKETALEKLKELKESCSIDFYIERVTKTTEKEIIR